MRPIEGFKFQPPEVEYKRRTVFELLQDHTLRVSWKREVQRELQTIFTGREYQPILEQCDAIHAQILKSRVFVALHMHAGDGNVHTNIPVNSDDYAMLKAANQAVARIMRLAQALGGVISGEHGIGLTKLEFLEPAGHRQIRRLQAAGRSARPLQPRQAAAGRRPAQCLHPQLQPAGNRIADHGAERDRRHRGFDQGLPALRQVQAGVQHPHPARQPALQPAQQDSRHQPADRGLPV